VIRVVLCQLMAAALVCAGWGCGGGGRSAGGLGVDDPAQMAPAGFAEAMFQAIRLPDGPIVRRVMAPKDYVFGAQTFIDLRSPEQRYRLYEGEIRDKLLRVQQDLSARGFRWEGCVLASANILLANTQDHPTPPAVQRLHAQVVGGHRPGRAELLPALVPLVEGQRPDGIVFLFLEDGVQEAVVRVDTMPTKQGLRIELLAPRVEVFGVAAAAQTPAKPKPTTAEVDELLRLAGGDAKDQFKGLGGLRRLAKEGLSPEVSRQIVDHARKQIESGQKAKIETGIRLIEISGDCNQGEQILQAWIKNAGDADLAVVSEAALGNLLRLHEIEVLGKANPEWDRKTLDQQGFRSAMTKGMSCGSDPAKWRDLWKGLLAAPTPAPALTPVPKPEGQDKPAPDPAKQP